MNSVEARLILSAYRPNGADANDSVINEALEFARSNPETRAWFGEQLALDRPVVAALQQLPVPRNLLEELLAGVRICLSSHPPRRWLSFLRLGNADKSES